MNFDIISAREVLDKARSERDASLAQAFIWDATPEGHEFWENEFMALAEGDELSPEAEAALRHGLIRRERGIFSVLGFEVRRAE